MDKSKVQHGHRVTRLAGEITGGHGHHYPPSPIVNSWSRCFNDFALDPTSSITVNVLESIAVRERRERVDLFVRSARPEMDALLEQLAGSAFTVVLTDSAGVIVQCNMKPSSETLFRSAGVCLGGDWNERSVGTNGVGTCIEDLRPTTVFREEHFAVQNALLTCCGSPIFSPEGGLLGVLDASTVSDTIGKKAVGHIQALVNMAAKSIENKIFLAQCADDIVIRFHARREYVGLLNEGLIAVGRDGEIKAVNHAALGQLDLETRDAVNGRRVHDILDVSLDQLCAHTRQQDGPILPVRDTSQRWRFFVRVQAPSSRPTGRANTVQGTRREAGTLSLEDLAGSDPVMLDNARRARKLVDSDISILLAGETGSGKEAFARAIHLASARAAQPFVAVNCAAIPENLIESELFGYQRGAFTGARSEGMKGRILSASGGTLFLDEIGDMPLLLQTRLLRVLEDNEVVPLGCDRSTQVDLRVISATHHRLDELVAAGRFREDLYFRLNGLTLTIPPLRERQDLPDVIESLLRRAAGDCMPYALDPGAMRLLCTYPWPGNVRQLKNTLRVATAFAGGLTVRAADLPDELRAKALQPSVEAVPEPAGPAGSDRPLEDAERLVLQQTLEAHGWTISAAARTLGVSRGTLYRKLHKHGLAAQRPQR